MKQQQQQKQKHHIKSIEFGTYKVEYDGLSNQLKYYNNEELQRVIDIHEYDSFTINSNIYTRIIQLAHSKGYKGKDIKILASGSLAE